MINVSFKGGVLRDECEWHDIGDLRSNQAGVPTDLHHCIYKLAREVTANI